MAPKAASRTAVAARELLNALGDDIATLSTGQRQNLASVVGRSREWLSALNLAAVLVRTQALLRSAISALELRRSSGRGVARFAWPVILATGGSLVMIGSITWALQYWPAAKRLHHSAQPALLLEAQNGEPLGRMGVLKLPDVRREEFPKLLIEAVLSIEDHRFYRHFGVDPIGIARALQRNIEASEIVEGGSTITQQLVKMKYLGNDRTYARKLREALMAIALELGHRKDELLTEYLNNVYMGAGAYGMSAAARLYFDKTLSKLTLSEAAMLAGLIRSPSLFNPIHDLAAARERAGVVIEAMRRYGVIDEKTAKHAKVHPAMLNPSVGAAQARSWFADWASTEATGLTDAYTRSVRARTTLVPKLQRLAEQIVNDVLAKQGARLGASQAALVAMLPDGAVVAMVGGRDYDKSQFNRAAEANRHPGSAFKLFVYLAALRKGYLPNDVIDAGPVSIGGWRPENYGGRNYGAVTLADAFSRSINTAAVHLAMRVGLQNVIDAARDLGIDAPLKPYPSLALGAVGVSLVDLTGAFASVRAGRHVEPWGVAALGTGKESDLRAVGGILADGKPLGPARDAMVALLHRVVESGTGRRAALDGFAAGKTGTSQDYRDAWFIGFNEPLVTGVWVGNDDNSPMKRVVGGTLPAMIWHRFMTGATEMIEQEQVHIARHSLDIPKLSEGVPARAFGDDRGVMFHSDEGLCNVAACAQAYRSFRVSDCTYQSYSGLRRLCTKGSPGDGADNRTADAARAHFVRKAAPLLARPDIPVVAVGYDHETDSRNSTPVSCNTAACEKAYHSFRASDCTYQPYRGARRLCEKAGNSDASDERHNDERRADSGAQSFFPFTEVPADRLRMQTPDVAAGRQPPRCDVDRCVRRYRSFDPSDCTYQPYGGGPRRFCER
jgi:penicillin-binding protein 1A